MRQGARAPTTSLLSALPGESNRVRIKLNNGSLEIIRWEGSGAPIQHCIFNS
jgi:hypothetical protein